MITSRKNIVALARKDAQQAATYALNRTHHSKQREAVATLAYHSGGKWWYLGESVARDHGIPRRWYGRYIRSFVRKVQTICREAYKCGTA